MKDDKATEEKKEVKVKPVTFMDRHYLSRKIKVGNSTLQVTGGKVTATTAEQIDACRKDKALTEVR